MPKHTHTTALHELKWTKSRPRVLKHHKPLTSISKNRTHSCDQITWLTAGQRPCWQSQTESADPAVNSTWSTFHLLLRCSRARAFSIDKWTSEMASWWARSLMCFMPSFTWVSSSLNNCRSTRRGRNEEGKGERKVQRKQKDRLKYKLWLKHTHPVCKTLGK